MSDKPLTMQDIFEKNTDLDAEIDYRNAIRHLLREACVRHEINKPMEEQLWRRDPIGSFYHYMFGTHPAEKESNQLISESIHDDANATIRANNTASQFYDYISGYRHAADALVMNAMITGNENYRSSSAFPICFLYRQYLELTLKDMYLYYSADSEEDKDGYIKRTNHNLWHVWENKVVPMVKPLLQCKRQVDESKIAEGYIKELQDLDPDSYVFRYPIKKNRDRYHKVSKKINLPGLMKKMNELEKFIAFTSALLDINKMRRDGKI